MPTLRIRKYKYDAYMPVDNREWEEEQEAQNNVLRYNSYIYHHQEDEAASSNIISNNQNAIITGTHINIPSTARVASTFMATCNNSTGLAPRQAESCGIIPNDKNDIHMVGASATIEPAMYYDQHYDVQPPTAAYYKYVDADSVIPEDNRDLIDADISLEPTCSYSSSSTSIDATGSDEETESLLPPQRHDLSSDTEGVSTYTYRCGKGKDNIPEQDMQIECKEKRNPNKESRERRTRKQYSDTVFDKGFDALMAYKKEHNHCNVPATRSGTKNKYYYLGQWCSKLRQSYKKIQQKHQNPLYLLSDEQIQRLTEAGFDWRVQNWMPSFDTRFDELMAYKKEHNHCNVPGTKNGNKYYSLGLWCYKLRQSYKQIQLKQKPLYLLSDEQIQRLTEAGFDWRVQNWMPNFDTRFDELMAYKKEHNHCNVPSDKLSKYYSLGVWCNNLRQSYKEIKRKQKPKISLSDEKIQRLTEAGFQWELQGQKPRLHFDKRFDELMAYKKEHNHCNVPPTRSSKYFSLGKWCYKLRRSYKQIQQKQKPLYLLSDEQIQRLTEAGFDWRVQNWMPSFDTRFDTRFDELMAYKKEHNHCNVPGTKPGNKYYTLGQWCYKLKHSYNQIQRNEKPLMSLSDEQIQRLTEGGFDWRTCFDKRFDELMAFKKEHNHCNVPGTKNGTKKNSLGQWCIKLRQSYKRIQKNEKPLLSLSDEKIRRLTEAGFQWELQGQH